MFPWPATSRDSQVVSVGRIAVVVFYLQTSHYGEPWGGGHGCSLTSTVSASTSTLGTLKAPLVGLTGAGLADFDLGLGGEAMLGSWRVGERQ